MSEHAHISKDVRRLPRIIEENFKRALVESVAPSIARAWRNQIVTLDVIDSRTYLEAVDDSEPVGAGGVTTVTVEAPEAAGYAAAIRRKGESYYVGRRVADLAVETSERDAKAALDDVGRRVKG